MTRRESIRLLASAGVAALAGQETATACADDDTPLLHDWLRLLCLGVNSEYDYVARVEGAIPTALRGILYRNGPGLFERNGYKKTTLLDGDGLVRSFEIGNGSVRFRSRFVQTQKFKQESAAGRFLHPTWTTLAPRYLDNLPAIPALSQAGVTPLVKGSRLLAFDEVGLPYELDPTSLETIAQADPFDLPAGHSGINFKAHTKTDGVSGEWVMAGGQAGANPDLHVLLQDANGRRISHVSLPNPRPHYTYYHDFFWAGRYAVFHLHPAFLSPLPMLLGRRSFADCISWHAGEGSLWAVVDTRGQEPPVFVEGPAAWMWHSVNAFDSGDRIVADFVGYDEPDHFLGPGAVLRNVMRGREGRSIHPGTVRRFTIDIKAKRGTMETLADGHFEFPAIHPAFVGRRHRYVYLASGDLRDGWFHNGVARVDVETGSRIHHRFGADCCASEPVFVPDPEVSPLSPAAETSGWLMSEVLDGGTGRSYLAILDASRVAAGPIARVHLEHHLPVSFHGWWQAV